MKVTLKDGTKVYITPYNDGEPKCAEDEKANLVYVNKQPMPGRQKIHPDVLPYSIRMLQKDEDGLLVWASMPGDSMTRIAKFFAKRHERGHKMLNKWWWTRARFKKEVKE